MYNSCTNVKQLSILVGQLSFSDIVVEPTARKTKLEKIMLVSLKGFVIDCMNY